MPDQESKALKYAFRILAIRPRSVFEMKEKLRNRKYSPPIVEEITRELKRQNLLNDEKFAKDWVRNQLEYRPCGRILIRKKLIEKRIVREIIDRVLEELVPPEKEKEIAQKIAQQKKDKLKNLSSQQQFQKLGLFLTNKGFSYQIVKEALGEIINN